MKWVPLKNKQTINGLTMHWCSFTNAMANALFLNAIQLCHSFSHLWFISFCALCFQHKRRICMEEWLHGFVKNTLLKPFDMQNDLDVWQITCDVQTGRHNLCLKFNAIENALHVYNELIWNQTSLPNIWNALDGLLI